MRLENKVAIITGAGSGIGRETSRMFATEGAKIVVADMDEKGGRETVDKILAQGGDSFFIKMDVVDLEQVMACVKKTLETYGKIDILINNAGIVQDALISKMTLEQWDRVMDVNLKGVFNCTKLVVEHMAKQGSGVIINASSVVGLFGNVGQSNYATTKAGLIGMTKSLAKELGRKGIRVNAIAPGFIETPMTAGVPDKVLDIMKEKTPIRRIGEAKDIAYAYTYLASDEAKFVTGAILSIDGGLVI